MKKMKFANFFAAIAMLSFGSQAFALMCSVYYEGSSATYSVIYSAENEWDAKAKFEKDFPGRTILNIVCTR